MNEYIPNPDFRRVIEDAVIEGNNAFMLLLSKAVTLNLNRRGSGRIYRVAKGVRKGRNLRARGKHQASSPGEPPAPNTGSLRASWTVGSSSNQVVRYRDQSKIGLLFGSPLHYARIDSGYGRVAARPYLQPSLEKVADLHATAIARAIKAQTGARG